MSIYPTFYPFWPYADPVTCIFYFYFFKKKADAATWDPDWVPCSTRPHPMRPHPIPPPRATLPDASTHPAPAVRAAHACAT
eukprot:SAG11_NODE_22802_length_400_cov_0.368771_1_plen_80_part_01